MNTLAERSLRVAMLGYVPDDDPTVIADMQAEIESLRSELQVALDRFRIIRDGPADARECALRLAIPDIEDALKDEHVKEMKRAAQVDPNALIGLCAGGYPITAAPCEVCGATWEDRCWPEPAIH